MFIVFSATPLYSRPRTFSSANTGCFLFADILSRFLTSHLWGYSEGMGTPGQALRTCLFARMDVPTLPELTNSCAALLGLGLAEPGRNRVRPLSTRQPGSGAAAFLRTCEAFPIWHSCCHPLRWGVGPGSEKLQRAAAPPQMRSPVRPHGSGQVIVGPCPVDSGCLSLGATS